MPNNRIRFFSKEMVKKTEKMKLKNFFPDFDLFRGYAEYGSGIVVLSDTIIKNKPVWYLFFGIFIFIVGCWDIAKYSKRR